MFIACISHAASLFMVRRWKWDEKLYSTDLVRFRALQCLRSFLLLVSFAITMIGIEKMMEWSNPLVLKSFMSTKSGIHERVVTLCESTNALSVGQGINESIERRLEPAMKGIAILDLLRYVKDRVGVLILVLLMYQVSSIVYFAWGPSILLRFGLTSMIAYAAIETLAVLLALLYGWDLNSVGIHLASLFLAIVASLLATRILSMS